jgi:hypothetical protein
MASLNDVQPAPSPEARRNALQAVLGSATFTKNPRLAALLEYLCVRCLRGETSAIKEYSIATDVFGRSLDFDQSTDAIVRVEMHRLRKKLREFYAGEGADQPVEIVIQSGHYLPEFIPHQKCCSVTKNDASGVRLDPAVVWVEPATPSKTPAKIHFRGVVRIALATAAIIAVVALIIFGVTLTRQNAAAPLSPTAISSLPPVAAAPSGEAVRILCGQSRSGYRDRQGNRWGADAFYSGGIAAQAAGQAIYRTRDPNLYQSMRSGEFSYKIPLKPGTYELRLHFADTSYTPGPAMEGGENVRMFNLSLNGKPVLRNFDIVADAGPSTADVRVYKDVSPAEDGYLHLQWAKVTDTPLVNAIEVTPGIPHRLHPIRIVTQDNTFTDSRGVLWSSDDYFLGGRSMARFGTVTGPSDRQLYERERYGNFSYAIPVAEGRYAVTLYFADTYFGPNEAGGGGAGSRIFDVYCNGTALLRNFDIFREGGSHHQVIKTFHGLTPNAQGKLLLSFIPVLNYANISAIEVMDETQ